MTLRTDLSDLTSVGQTQQTPSRRNSRRLVIIALLLLLLLLLGGTALALRGTGLLGKIKNKFFPPKPEVTLKLPTISGSESIPADCATGIDPAAPLLIRIDLPNGPLDPKTVSDDSVGIFRFDTRQRVPAKVTIVPAGLAVTPTAPLEANHNYRVQVPPGLKDVEGQPVRQNTRAFFTSAKPPAGVAFEKVTSPEAVGEGFTSLNFGPDGKLYASTHDGKLCRFVVNADGTLSGKEVFTTLQVHEKGPRLFTGFTFDPKSTADHMVIYLTSSEFGFGVPNPVTDFTGKIHRLSGANFETIEDLVINLPRSARDHATNQPKFGPDGALYIPQPSNTAVGGPDKYWFYREEHGLNATILRLDVNAITPGQTIDAKTTDSGGPFVAESTNTPLTIYAKGLRMPYDLLWHSNGNLYTGVNGASSTGATPAGTKNGVSVRGIARVELAEHDWFFKVEKGHYYGHTNPTQNYFVLNGGNPTAGPDFDEVADYPVGTMPDPDWTPAIFDFGMHVSADGLVEYKSDQFNGALKNKIFICRYNVGSDLLCLTLGSDGNVVSAVSGIPGLGGRPESNDILVGPLDVIDEPKTGNMYVAEYHEQQPALTQITLLRAIPGTTVPAK